MGTSAILVLPVKMPARSAAPLNPTNIKRPAELFFVRMNHYATSLSYASPATSVFDVVVHQLALPPNAATTSILLAASSYVIVPKATSIG